MKAIFNWSGGKDSSLALYKILTEKKYTISTLLTSINKKFERISMHGVREDLLDAQTKSIDLPLTKLYLPEQAKMEDYNKIMQDTLTPLKNAGAQYSIFGDIFLEDLKKYREEQLAKVGLKGIFPLWQQDTQTLAKKFIDVGFKAIITCIDEKKLNKSHVGQVYNQTFLNSLPNDVDPCGENGEFHTFVYKGPIFKNEIPFEIGEKTHKRYPTSEKDFGFWFCDLLPRN